VSPLIKWSHTIQSHTIQPLHSWIVSSPTVSRYDSVVGGPGRQSLWASQPTKFSNHIFFFSMYKFHRWLLDQQSPKTLTLVDRTLCHVNRYDSVVGGPGRQSLWASQPTKFYNASLRSDQVQNWLTTAPDPVALTYTFRDQIDVFRKNLYPFAAVALLGTILVRLLRLRGLRHGTLRYLLKLEGFLVSLIVIIIIVIIITIRIVVIIIIIIIIITTTIKTRC
jgi:hypothetical protein